MLTFFSGPWVCDPQQPEGHIALIQAPKDKQAWVDWFDDHPHLELTGGTPEPWKPASGHASGIRFYVKVKSPSPENELTVGWGEGAGVRLFPFSTRLRAWLVTKGKTNLVTVLEREGETMLILAEGLPQYFNEFKARVDKEVLANLSLV
jgi:hypothetical protein